MKRSIPLALVSLILVTVALAMAGSAAPAPAQDDAIVRPSLDFTLDPGDVAPPPSAEQWRPRHEVLPGPAAFDKRGGGGGGFPMFTNSITAAGKKYSFTLVGPDPSKAGAKNVSVGTMIFPVVFHFADGNVFDPTAPDACLGGNSPLALALASPIFQSADYGDGPRQFVEQVMRSQFWHFLSLNPNYSVRLSPSLGPVLNVTLGAAFTTQAANCGRLGLLDLNTWNNFLQKTIFPALKSYGVGPSNFPQFLFTNVAMYNAVQSNCCTLGFHTWFNSKGKQTYAVSMIDSTRDFKGVADVSTLAHEIGEWYMDPLTNNATPAWGHTGQVSGCQSNLEVGDPLSGTPQPITLNGITYHPQELAFFSWFFGQSSLGVNGLYSSNGAFTTPAAACP